MNTEKQLKEYMDGGFNLTPILNILLNDMSVDFYEKLGKYIYYIYDGKLPKTLSYFDELKNGDFRFFGTMFATGHLDKEALTKIFGEGLYHNEFGEGFEEEDNIDFEYVSWFGTLNNVKFHIGCDHRGTRIELENNKTSEEVYKFLKKLVDLYKKVYQH